MRVGIVGAGCAGSSLAYYLVRGGFSGEIELFDRRSTFDTEQRWCSWGPMPEAFAPLVSHSWPYWSVVDDAGSVRRSVAGRPYLHLYAPDFYHHVFAYLADSPHVHLHHGVTVSHSAETARGVQIETSDGAITVDHLFDSRPSPSGPVQRGAAHRTLQQSFVGQVVRVEVPVFDTSTATLMDFRGRPTEHDSLPFMYVLPFTPTSALVESTAFAEKALSLGEHRERIGTYLEERGITRYVVEREELGTLPMSAAPAPLHPGHHHATIGMAAGALRPSSGYGFVRIQRHTQAVAAALLADDPLPTHLARPLDTLLDAIFLDAMDISGGRARDDFMRMFERVPPARLVRFMSDEGTVADLQALIRALPLRPYVRAALGQLTASTSRLPGRLWAHVAA